MILTSGAIDLHDDIIDQSTVRKNRPTILGKFGADVALLTADALLFKGLLLMHEMVELGVSPEKARMVIRTVKKLLFELGDGEALELRFRGRLDISPEEYLHVVRKKAADVEAYMRIGAILGGGSNEEVDVLGEYGRILGMMAILRDYLEDMLDFEGEMPNIIKKEALPLPLLYALRKPEERASIVSIIKGGKFGRKEIEGIFELTEDAGGLQYLDKALGKLAKSGMSLLKTVKHKRRELELIMKATIPPL